MVSTGTDKQWQGLCEILGMPDLVTDNRYLTNALRLEHRDSLADHLRERFLRFESQQLLRICREQQVPIAQIRNMQEVFDVPAAQNLILEESMPDGTVSKRVKTAVFKIHQ